MGPRDAVGIIDADVGRSGTSTAGRSGFAELTNLVGLGQVGIVLALEVSRLARNNSDWYRLRTWPSTTRGYSATGCPTSWSSPVHSCPSSTSTFG